MACGCGALYVAIGLVVFVYSDSAAMSGRKAVWHFPPFFSGGCFFSSFLFHPSLSFLFTGWLVGWLMCAVSNVYVVAASCGARGRVCGREHSVHRARSQAVRYERVVGCRPLFLSLLSTSVR